MPTLIKIVPNQESQRKIIEYLEENRGVISSPKSKFHSTILYSKTKPYFKRGLIEDLVKKYLPVKVIPNSLDVFGENELVLHYESKKVGELEDRIIGECIRQILRWPDLNQYERSLLKKSQSATLGETYLESNYHVTIAKNFSGDVKELTKFNEEIVFDNLVWSTKF